MFNALDRFLDRPDLPILFLRTGLVVVLLYAGIGSLVNPQEWVGYLPPFITERFDAETLLTFWSIYELALAAWIITGIRLRYASLVTAVTLVAIILANVTLLPITFRDFAIASAALALASLAKD